MVGGRGTEERHPGQVTGVRAGRRWIEIDHHHVDGVDATLREGRDLVPAIAPGADRPDQVGIGQVGQYVSFDTRLGQVGPRLLGRGAQDPGLLKRANQLDDPFAVRNGEQGSQ